MCWYLYGCVNAETDKAALEELNALYDYKFAVGTPHKIKNDVREQMHEFAFTGNVCDCDTKVGTGNAKAEDVLLLSDFLADLANIQGFRQAAIAKCWRDKLKGGLRKASVKREEIPEFLANLEENMVYALSIQ